MAEADEGDLLGHELSAAVIRFHREIASALGVTLAEHKLIDELLVRGPLTPTALADALEVTRPAITKTVDALVGRRLLVRGRSAVDGRSVVITPSEALTARMAEIYGPLSARMAETAESLSDADRDVIVRWIRQSVEILDGEARALSETE